MQLKKAKADTPWIFLKLCSSKKAMAGSEIHPIMPNVYKKSFVH